MELNRLFSPADLEAVRATTAAAEARTGGEVVSMVVPRCDRYEGAAWKGAALGALAASLAAALWLAFAAPWRPPPALLVALPTLCGAGLGYLLAFVSPPLLRALAGAETLDRRVARRAAAAFFEEGIGATRGRTGVLILVALFERRVRVVADQGVASRVDDAHWVPIADALAAGMRAGRPAAALVEAIAACGELLERFHVERARDDADELPDDLRLRDA